MIGKIIRAEIGRRVARDQSPLVGLVVGAAAPWLLRRAFTPLGLAVAGAYAAKKLYDKKKERDQVAVRLDSVLRSAPTPAPAPAVTTTSSGAPAAASGNSAAASSSAQSG